jgi:hypothetical protein
MSGSFDTLDTTGESKRTAAPERTFALDATLVRYDGRPDRCTVYSAEATRLERMVEWISADADTFVSLEDAR